MQEEVTQKTIALYVKVGKARRGLPNRRYRKQSKSFGAEKQTRAWETDHAAAYEADRGCFHIEITDSNIKAFESTAKKYNIDFSLKKVKGAQTRYLVFFKGRDADVMTAAFQEFSAKKLNRRKSPLSAKPLPLQRTRRSSLTPPATR